MQALGFVGPGTALDGDAGSSATAGRNGSEGWRRGIRQMLDRRSNFALLAIGVLVLVAALICRASLRQTTGPRR